MCFQWFIFRTLISCLCTDNNISQMFRAFRDRLRNYRDICIFAKSVGDNGKCECNTCSDANDFASIGNLLDSHARAIWDRDKVSARICPKIECYSSFSRFRKRKH